MRVVLDLNVVVSALIEPRGAPRAVIRAALQGHLEVVVCPRWATELAIALGRPKIARRVTPAESTLLVEALLADAELRPDPTAPAPVTRDPNDDYLVALALDAGCDAICSGDGDLVAYAGPPEVVTARQLVRRLDLRSGSEG